MMIVEKWDQVRYCLVTLEYNKMRIMHADERVGVVRKKNQSFWTLLLLFLIF